MYFHNKSKLKLLECFLYVYVRYLHQNSTESLLPPFLKHLNDHEYYWRGSFNSLIEFLALQEKMIIWLILIQFIVGGIYVSSHAEGFSLFSMGIIFFKGRCLLCKRYFSPEICELIDGFLRSIYKKCDDNMP